MRALILGAAGAIGSAIARHAQGLGLDTHAGVRSTSSCPRLDAHPSVHRHVLDVRDPASVRAVVDRAAPDWIAMAAFPSAGPAINAGERHALLLAASESVLAVMEALRESRFSGSLIWIGSALAYGKGGTLREPGDALCPQTFRGAVKAAESVLAAQLAGQFGIALTELRVFTGYGPFEQRGRLVASLLRAALCNGRVPIATWPARRDWIHYDDIAAAAVAASRAAQPGHRVFNIGSGGLHDTRQVALALERIVDKPLIAEHAFEGGDHYGDVAPGRLPSAGEGLDWAPRLDLAQGLQRAWDWAQSPVGRAYLCAGQAA